ncbi:hypothetical protein HY620_03175, partial [Candidatus Uhrbacteria bacterium]|nr:hypothetical protein [Candidatus Uhrbacteria bacterium]
MPRNLCKHCDPLPASPAHWAEKFDDIFGFPLFSYRVPEIISRFFYKTRAFTHWLLFSLLLPRLFAEKNIDESWQSLIYNRSRVIIDEARERGFSIFALSFFGLRTHILSLYTPTRKIIFEELPTLQ